MVLLFSVFSVLYCAWLLWLYVHWTRISTESLADAEQVADSFPSLSVVIPVRNEAATISLLLQDLSRQTDRWGGKVLFDVMVVDDASTDSTAEQIHAFQQSSPYRLELLSLKVPAGFVGSHKKLALQQAIASAGGEIIVTTDGDCRVGPRWLATIQHFFARHQPVLLSGPVTFCEEESLFEHLQTVEFASLIGVGAASLQAGRPTMCNGANLSFLREAFYEVQGYKGLLHVPSGDDEFLLQKLFRRYPHRLAFLKQPEATVRTKAQSTMRGFYQQRKRWASKWKLHRDYRVAALAVFIFAYYLSGMIVTLLAVSGRYPWWVWGLQLLPKVLLEHIFLKSVLALMKKPLNPIYFGLMQLIYAPYAVFFGMRANFGGYTWKNRPYN